MSADEQTPETRPVIEWLVRDYPDSPKKRLKEWFVRGRIFLDGEPITKPHQRLADPGERLSVGKASATARLMVKRMPTRVHAQLNLLYIDRSLAIVNKGAGLLSVPLPESTQPSALSLLEAYLQKGQMGARREKAQELLRPLPVHRLDQFTSGLLCFAMNEDARTDLIRQVREHSFLREYLALGDGQPKPQKGTWRAWFKLDEAGMEQTVFDAPVSGATEGISHYDVLDTIRWSRAGGPGRTVSRLRLRLETGLKHQLRIHAARAGVPLLGDRFYHPDFRKAVNAGTKPPFACKRQALHASSIGFVHPETGKTKRFSCKFPKDLAELEQRLRNR